MLSGKRAGSSWRKLRAGWRDTQILLAEFRLPLTLYIVLILVAGGMYYSLSQSSSAPLHSPAEAVYFIISLTTLQPLYPFPELWYLQVFYFLTPIAGIGILALGLAEFGTLFFNRRTRGKEWQMAVASTVSNHIVLVGLGHLGYRVVMQLVEMGLDVVVIELNPRSDLRDAILRMDVALIEEDASRENVLEKAGIRRARTIMLCTQNDSLNLEIALKSRTLKPGIEVVIRIFDDSFADSLQKQFGFRALSATGMAAPLFAASAANVDITPPVTIEGVPHVLARMQIDKTSHLNRLTIRQVEEKYHTSIILLSRAGVPTFHPDGNQVLTTGDSLAFFGTPDSIRHLIHENR